MIIEVHSFFKKLQLELSYTGTLCIYSESFSSLVLVRKRCVKVDCIPSAAGQIAGLAVDSLAVAETPVDVPLALQSDRST